jgi:glycosyltransferase involved in cell wall biosynthesis
MYLFGTPMSSDKPAISILHFSTGKYLRGGERQVAWLHGGLSKRGCKSMLACIKGGELAAQGLQNTISVPWLGEWDIGGLVRFTGICKKHRPSVIHCHDAHALAHGVLAGRRLGIPVVYTRRVVFPINASYFSHKKYRACAAIIAISNAVAAQCKEVVSPDRVHIVGDGADWSAPLLARPEARKRLGIPGDTFIFGTVAHFTAEKDMALLFYLANSIQTQKPGARLACIGPFDEKQKKRYSIPESIVCAGKLDNAVQYYSAFDAYVSTSSAEGLGSALLDAIVRDIPCVAVDAGGTPDLFPDGWQLAARGDHKGFTAQVMRLMDDYPAAQAAAKRCGARARNIFSVDTMVEKTMSVYTTVASL